MTAVDGVPEPVPSVRGVAGRVVPSAAAVAVLVIAAGWTWGASATAWAGDYADVPGMIRWTLASITEPQFYAVGSVSAFLLLGGLAGHVCHRRGWRFQGFVQACGTGIWPPVAGAGVASIGLSTLLWGWALEGGLWQPLFVPLVSVAPAVVVLYGPGRRVAVTAAVAGAVLAPPPAMLLVSYVCRPLDIPLVVGATAGMTLAAAAGFWICRRLPWMPQPWAWRATAPEPRSTGRRPADSGPIWVLRRTLADLTEAQFFGNEWASAALVAGALIAHLTAPESLVYGTGLFMTVLVAQLLTALLGVVVWRRRWRDAGFYPTFVPVVSVVPAAVLSFDGAIVPTLVATVLGALIAPPTAAAISARLPGSFHPFVGNVAAMSICTALLVPPLAVLPGAHP